MDWSHITKALVGILRTSGPVDSGFPGVLNFFEHSPQYMHIYALGFYELNTLYYLLIYVCTYMCVYIYVYTYYK